MSADFWLGLQQDWDLWHALLGFTSCWDYRLADGFWVVANGSGI